MSKIIPALKYREHCTNQLRQGVKPLTRKQAKALKQYQETTKGQPHNIGYKNKVTVLINI